jgi:hypothetical protein
MVEPLISTTSTGAMVWLVLCEMCLFILAWMCMLTCSHVLEVDVNLYGLTTSMCRVDECLSHNHFLHMFVPVDVNPDG